MRLLSFYAGIIQFIISLFQLGKAFDWLPDYFISAFISGVSFHVITSQIFHMFGIDKKGFLIGSRSRPVRSFENPRKDFENGPIWSFSQLVPTLRQY